LEWIAPELEILKKMSQTSGLSLNIDIYVTRESQVSRPDYQSSKEMSQDVVSTVSVSSLLEPHRGFNVAWLENHHPKMTEILQKYLDNVLDNTGRVQVVASGPAEMGRDVGAAVASCNDGAKVWKGSERHDVELHWDDRMG
jgi:ferric-chelate reductase